MDPHSLQNLRDIVEPSAIPFWPPALGVWVILALVLVWIIAVSIIWWSRWRKNAYRRAALSELEELKSQIGYPSDGSVIIGQLSELLKRVALVAYPREKVASLSGDKWLSFLEDTGKINFSSGPGQILTTAIYESDPGLKIEESDFEKLFSLSRGWIVEHKI